MNHRLAVCLAAAALVLFCTLSFATVDSVPQRTGDEVRRPVVFLYQHVTANSKLKGGLRYAVWDDGVVLYLPGWSEASPAELGKLVGSVEDLVKQLRADGLVETPSTSVSVPGGDHLMISYAIGGKENDFGWDEVIRPNYGANGKPTDKYRNFAANWTKTKITLASLQVTGARPLAPTDLKKGSFRGYSLDTPGATPWLFEKVK